MEKCTTQLKVNIEGPISMGPVKFFQNPNGIIEVQAEIKRQIYDALHLLYFAANAYKIYYDLKPDSLENYFEKKEDHPLIFTEFSFETLDKAIFQAFAQLLNTKEKECLRLIQAVKCFNESISRIDKSIPHESWQGYLMLSKGFEVLFNLNPAFPSADLRQHLRPILHLKFSHPVELLWKWVDRFYESAHATLAGEQFEDSLFIENPNVRTPYLLIAEKLLIFSIYDTVYAKKLMQGDSGTASIPDDFNFIHPERVLVYFWTQDTLEKKMALLNLQEHSERDLSLLNKIKEMHRKLQNVNASNLRRENFQN